MPYAAWSKLTKHGAFDYNQGYVYYGESGLNLHRYNLVTNGFKICTRLGLTAVESFLTADKLLTRVVELMPE